MTIKLDKRYYGGDKFVITAKNNSKQNVYVKPSKRINGSSSKAGSIKFSDVVKGGSMELTMSKKP